MLAFLIRLMRLAAPYRARLVLGILFGVLGGLTEPLLVIIIPLVGRIVFPSADVGGVTDYVRNVPSFVRPMLEPLVAWLNQPGTANTDLARVLAISLIPLVVLLRGLFGYLNVYFMQWAAVRTVIDLRTRLFAHLQSLSLSFFTRSNTGELISRITSDTYALQYTISGAVPVIIRDPITLASLAAVLLTLHPKMTVFTLLVFPAYLQHSVDANDGSENRVSMSFNLMFSAFTEGLSKPLWGDE